jgi:hypothetical protein
MYSGGESLFSLQSSPTPDHIQQSLTELFDRLEGFEQSSLLIALIEKLL